MKKKSYFSPWKFIKFKFKKKKKKKACNKKITPQTIKLVE
jgi:hypothetical protein